MVLKSKKNCELFADLTDAEFAELSPLIVQRTVAAGNPIIEEGTEAFSLFAIDQGSVDIFKSGDGGIQPRITELFAGAIFGEIAFWDHATRSAAVVAHTDTTILEIQYSDLKALAARLPMLGLKLYGAIAMSLSKKTRQTTHDLVSLVAASRMAALGELTSGIAHEIKNPLTAITLNIDLLGRILQEETIDPKQAEERLGAIKTTTQRVLKIIDGLRGLDHASHGDEAETLRVKQVIDDALALHHEKLSQRNVKLITSNTDVELTIKCRPIQISQVLLNLLNNALDANECLPQAEKWIRLEVTYSGSHVEIAITDAGPGIDSALHDRIFQPFFTTKGSDVGTGLGLSISRGIAERHGGSLLLDPLSPNTRFVLRIPKA